MTNVYPMCGQLNRLMTVCENRPAIHSTSKVVGFLA
jgi:hypothetical protein